MPPDFMYTCGHGSDPIPDHAESADTEDLVQAVDKGSRCDNKEVYRIRREDDPERFRWVDEMPKNFSSDEKGKTKKARETYAVNVFHRFDDDNDEWIVDHVRVNSSLLHVALEEILEGYPGLTQHELKVFRPPFLGFIHRWNDLIVYVGKVDPASETYEHLRLLQRTLEPLLEKSFATIREVEQTGHVAFKDLPLIYVPGTIAFEHETRGAGIVRTCVLTFPPCRPPRYMISVDVVEWDGRRCGLLQQYGMVPQYDGLRALSALEVSPMNGLPDQVELCKDLIERGRVYEKLRGQFFMAFTDLHAERRNERMVIGARAYYKHEKSGQFPEYASLTEIGRLTWAQSMNRYSSALPSALASSVAVDLSPMTDAQCLLTQAKVHCFNIEAKKWEELDLTKLHNIKWAQHAFSNLVLAQDEKDLLVALVDRDQFTSGKPFDDFIGGKGQGMIMLLCGPPGVGKTLTAESVAEHLRRPLYKLGAGDLGTDAEMVERKLDRALKLCAHFGAVLLIDEADVFMEARLLNNLQRNELVSVFLRLLEYYNGIMILTTNRMRSIDTAFESRVDITLSYNDLTEADRKQVWKNFLAIFEPSAVDVSEADLASLARWDFNGRQIKSAIKTARILATKEQEPLNARHLEIVLNLRRKALGMMNGEEVITGATTNGF
ncbi:P-loop containing nucleoside triphosphate hydrolase protein [Setomelanomma holmii]|uniref:P-loop containing nucleoside triphosphate hydrolase protein n=1 Tax=Setomelanomma holmii TaxID=210430 RepID=A0A9P4H4U2_9PLEO|nr:P-loop containing nucleoside triphosphate hydrolase protein [Setomelanomma holmii]